ncbi:LA-like protein [Mya arenaria]|uniref:LA-like protein n=1 Tax=Mya arenaria TaxID=6604 RepID=A0ABY7EPA9_MYAAR|nr:LA-like protein [Mya arenaria]
MATETSDLEKKIIRQIEKEFPKDAKLEDLQEYFESFGPCDNIQMRKDVHKKFKGAILHMKGFDDKTTREDIKNLLGDYGPIAWVDFNKGDPEAWVRYDQENKATDVLEKVTAAMDGKVELNGKTLENRVLEGEEEAARWKKMFQDIRNRMSGNQRRNQKGKSRFGKRPSKRVRDDKRGKNTGGDGGGEKANGEPAAKQAKVGDS